MTNLTHAALDHERRIEALEQQLAEAQANLTAHLLADHVVLRVLLGRELVAAERWEAALSDVSAGCRADLQALPILGPYASEIRRHAEGILNGTLNSVGDAIGDWIAAGRPDLTDDLEMLN